jgi:hypothetical protein
LILASPMLAVFLSHVLNPQDAARTKR